MTNVRMVSQKCHRVAWEHEVGIQCEVAQCEDGFPKVLWKYAWTRNGNPM